VTGYWKSGQALEQDAQGSGWVTIPGGVQRTCRCGSSGYGLVDVVVGWWLDLILEVFSNLYDSMFVPLFSLIFCKMLRGAAAT